MSLAGSNMPAPGTKSTGHWQPSALPGVSEQGYLVAALYGDLVGHPWRDPLDTSHPLFLFDHRSSDMGWTDDLHDGNSAWKVYEAGPEQDAVEAPANRSPAFWFHAGIGIVPDGRSLPIWPFLRCAGDVAARIGTFDLHAVQLLMPVQKLHQQRGKGFIPALQNYSWFIATDPSARTEVRVTLDSGEDPSIPIVASEMLALIQSFDQQVLVCDSLIDHDPLAPEFPLGDQFWANPSLHKAVISGTIAEWSVDALGWLAAFLSDVAADLGVSTPLLLTATRLS